MLTRRAFCQAILAGAIGSVVESVPRTLFLGHKDLFPNPPYPQARHYYLTVLNGSELDIDTLSFTINDNPVDFSIRLHSVWERTIYGKYKEVIGNEIAQTIYEVVLHKGTPKQYVENCLSGNASVYHEKVESSILPKSESNNSGIELFPINPVQNRSSLELSLYEDEEVLTEISAMEWSESKRRFEKWKLS